MRELRAIARKERVRLDLPPRGARITEIAIRIQIVLPDRSFSLGAGAEPSSRGGQTRTHGADRYNSAMHADVARAKGRNQAGGCGNGRQPIDWRGRRLWVKTQSEIGELVCGP